MDDVRVVVTALLVGVGAVGAMWLIRLAALAFELMRVEFGAHMALRPLAEPPEFDAPQRAALQALQDLGFQIDSYWTLDLTAQLHYHHVLLRHASQPAWAELTLQPWTYTGYPVTFSTPVAGAAPRLLCTVNRMGWIDLETPGVDLLDSFGASLAAHWQAHQARLEGANLGAMADAEARQLLISRHASLLPALQQRGALVRNGEVWHLGVRLAFRAAWRLVRSQHRIASPYTCAETTGTLLAPYQAWCHEQMEAIRLTRHTRRGLNLAVLLGSAALAGAAFWWWLGWAPALALMAVLFVHELGHALAMRVFGYRHLVMVFVPFVGAFVAGHVQGLAAWRQALVFAAGPLPGLLAGAALLAWGPERWALPVQPAELGLMAVSVNLFNLLPFWPLDGGRLMELALFARRPRLRLAFTVAGMLAVAPLLWSAGRYGWVLVALLALYLPAQWRMTKLHLADAADPAPDTRLQRLYEAAARVARHTSFVRLYPLVRGVVAQAAIDAPRPWERVAVLLVMGLVWGAVGSLAWGAGLMRPAQHWVDAQVREWRDARTEAQRRFDTAWSAYQDGEDEDAIVARLTAAARHLAPTDPRHFDLAVAQAWRLPAAQRSPALRRLSAARRAGVNDDPDNLVSGDLWQTTQALVGQPPAQAARLLQAELEAWARARPDAFAPTIAARLRWAELLDRGGDEAGAARLLEQVRQRADGADDCRCALRSVVAAQAHFHLAHGRSAQALAVLQQSSFGPRLREQHGALATAHARALLAQGAGKEAVQRMRQAVTRHREPSAMDRLLRRTPPPYVRDPAALAHIMLLAGQEAEARALLREPALRWACEDLASQGEPSFRGDAYAGPWQADWEREQRASARRLCPALERAGRGLGRAG